LKEVSSNWRRVQVKVGGFLKVKISNKVKQINFVKVYKDFIKVNLMSRRVERAGNQREIMRIPHEKGPDIIKKNKNPEISIIIQNKNS